MMSAIMIIIDATDCNICASLHVVVVVVVDPLAENRRCLLLLLLLLLLLSSSAELFATGRQTI
jgi:hypothetical protein